MIQTLAPQDLIVDTRWLGPYGIGRFSTEVLKRFPGYSSVHLRLKRLHPLDSPLLGLELLRRRPKVYFSPSFNPPLFSPVPFVFTIYDLIYVNFPQESDERKQLYFHYVVRPAVRRSYKVITNSEFSRQEIIHWAKVPEHKVVNASCGVDLSFKPQGPRYQPGFPYLLYVGSHSYRKNLTRLFRALARLDRIDIRLLLTGNPSSELEAELQRLGLVGRVLFTGFVPDEQMPAYYRGAEALVFPSLYEGFGLPPLEAMACGTPVITSNVCSLPEVVGNAGIMVDPYDTDALAGAIERVLSDSALRIELQQRGIIQAQRFSWERTAQRIWHILLEAASRVS